VIVVVEDGVSYEVGRRMSWSINEFPDIFSANTDGYFLDPDELLLYEKLWWIFLTDPKSAKGGSGGRVPPFPMRAEEGVR
jgi:hypothetical protein